MRLIGMTDFVLEQKDSYYNQRFFKIEKYANFLKQPLELWMFVPCDEDGNVLEEDLFKNNPKLSTLKSYKRIEYQQAKERCLFEGFSFDREDDDLWYFSTNDFFLIGVDKSKTIEYLIEYNLQLTKTAEKLIGL